MMLTRTDWLIRSCGVAVGIVLDADYRTAYRVATSRYGVCELISAQHADPLEWAAVISALDTE